MNKADPGAEQGRSPGSQAGRLENCAVTELRKASPTPGRFHVLSCIKSNMTFTTLLKCFAINFQMLPKNTLNYPCAIFHTWHKGPALFLFPGGQVRATPGGVGLRGTRNSAGPWCHRAAPAARAEPGQSVDRGWR